MGRKVHEILTIVMKTKPVVCGGMRFFFLIGSDIYERSVQVSSDDLMLEEALLSIIGFTKYC